MYIRAEFATYVSIQYTQAVRLESRAQRGLQLNIDPYTPARLFAATLAVGPLHYVTVWLLAQQKKRTKACGLPQRRAWIICQDSSVAVHHMLVKPCRRGKPLQAKSVAELPVPVLDLIHNSESPIRKASSQLHAAELLEERALVRGCTQP